MNFSELFRQTGQLCHFSPDGKYLANAVQFRLIIREVQTLQIVHLFTCLDTIQQIEWSPDSQFVLCGLFKRGLVQVWSLEQPEWACKIDEGSAGLVNAAWSPDSRHVLVTAEFNLRITIWSLTNKSVSYIKYPKACQKGMDFSKNGKYLALAERRDCKDHISIFDCSSWHLVKHFETDTEDLAGVQWSPDGRVLAVWESCLNIGLNRQVALVSRNTFSNQVGAGCFRYKVSLYSQDGRRMSTFSAYTNALGTKCLAWSPTAQFLAIGSYDQKLRLLNHVTWKAIVELSHPPVLDNPNAVVYKEVVSKPQLLAGETVPPSGVVFATKSRYDVMEGSVQVPVTKPDLNKPNPKLGVGLVSFSNDSRYFFSRNDNMPTALWIWDVQRLALSTLLIQDAPIKTAMWDPQQSRLAMSSGTNKVYMWSPAGCLAVEVPTEASFTVQRLKWHPNGKALCLIGREQMCVCFLTDPESPNDVSH